MKKLSEFEPNTGGMIRKLDTSGTCGHTSCSGGGKTCSGCMPEGGFQNMGSRWEVF